MRYPEREVVSVPAKRQYYEPFRPILLEHGSGERADGYESGEPERREPGVLRLDDVQGKLLIDTATHGRISIKAEQSAGDLETMSRWAVDPRRLIYLPPTMSPVNSSKREGYLEHPDEAFEYFRSHGVNELICEEKHMGSRAVVLVSRDAAPFGAPSGWPGIVHTRTGRRFFEDPEQELGVLARLDAALERAGLWEELGAEWVLFDGEMLPWSLKAGDLIRGLYASTAAAGIAATAASGVDVAALRERVRGRGDRIARFRDAYRRYVGQPGEVRFAPFQLLAAGAETYESRDHAWHMSIADRLVEADPELLRRTERVEARSDDEASRAAATRWWESLTEAGGEGMVVKSLANLTRSRKGAVQPGLKVRGRNTGHKQASAAREYALGLESLRRFTSGEPLWRVHQAVFGVLALESDPIDPRL